MAITGKRWQIRFGLKGSLQVRAVVIAADTEKMAWDIAKKACREKEYVDIVKEYRP